MRIFFLTYFHLKMKIAILLIGSNAYKCFKMFNIWFFFLLTKKIFKTRQKYYFAKYSNFDFSLVVCGKFLKILK